MSAAGELLEGRNDVLKVCEHMVWSNEDICEPCLKRDIASMKEAFYKFKEILSNMTLNKGGAEKKG